MGGVIKPQALYTPYIPPQAWGWGSQMQPALRALTGTGVPEYFWGATSCSSPTLGWCALEQGSPAGSVPCHPSLARRRSRPFAPCCCGLTHQGRPWGGSAPARVPLLLLLGAPPSSPQTRLVFQVETSPLSRIWVAFAPPGLGLFQVPTHLRVPSGGLQPGLGAHPAVSTLLGQG